MTTTRQQVSMSLETSSPAAPLSDWPSAAANPVLCFILSQDVWGVCYVGLLAPAGTQKVQSGSVRGWPNPDGGCSLISSPTSVPVFTLSRRLRNECVTPPLLHSRGRPPTDEYSTHELTRFRQPSKCAGLHLTHIHVCFPTRLRTSFWFSFILVSSSTSNPRIYPNPDLNLN